MNEVEAVFKKILKKPNFTRHIRYGKGFQGERTAPTESRPDVQRKTGSGNSSWARREQEMRPDHRVSVFLGIPHTHATTALFVCI